jgi:hypothetical protein
VGPCVTGLPQRPHAAGLPVPGAVGVPGVPPGRRSRCPQIPPTADPPGRRSRCPQIRLTAGSRWPRSWGGRKCQRPLLLST